MFRAIAVVIGVLSLTTHSLFAQQPPRSVNPEAIEFDPPRTTQAPGTEYRVEVFRAGADIQSDRPIRSVDLGALAEQDHGSLRVDLHEALIDVPDGVYIATLRAFGIDGPIDIGEPTRTFTLSRDGILPLAERTPRERFWMKVGFAIMGGILLVPFIVR